MHAHIIAISEMFRFTGITPQTLQGDLVGSSTSKTGADPSGQ
jgi:hypothetical protein